MTTPVSDSTAQQIDFIGVGPAAIDLDVRWIHGSPPGSADVDPPIQVHASDAHTFILRQSMAVSHEAPFLYLLFGNERALLVDTGATSDADRFPLRETVDRIIDAWLERHQRQRYELTIVHSHGHSDHIAADAQFEDRPDTEMIPSDIAALASTFAMEKWPDDIGKVDLGGRSLEVVATPGHHPSAITIFDEWTGLLLTGDTVYPGRLFVSDSAAYMASLERLVSFAGRRQVSHVLGGHVEMTMIPGRDYPLGASYQPDERALPMTLDQLIAVHSAMTTVSTQRGVHAFDDFVIYNRPQPWSLLRQIARAQRHRFTARRV